MTSPGPQGRSTGQETPLRVRESEPVVRSTTCGGGRRASDTGTCVLRSVMVFCISRTKSLKSLVPGACGCSSGADVAFPGCLLCLPTLHRRQGEKDVTSARHHQNQHAAPVPVQGRDHPTVPRARPPGPALPRRLPGPCSHGLVLRVAGVEGPPASEMIGERAELSPGPAV